MKSRPAEPLAKKTQRARPAPAPQPARDSFPIVGVGASAGGLEAFTDLLRHLPADTGMGFVLVQHLDPQHQSALTALLARGTTMPVREVTNNLRVAPDHIYVIPPNACMAIAGGVLKLTPRGKDRGAMRLIDFFFEALAQDQKERAIGVVLSGTATDGTLGLEAIKAEAGVTFAQDESAKYDSMPRSAIAAGVVDFVLAPEQIAAELARIATHPLVTGAQASSLRGQQASPPADATPGRMPGGPTGRMPVPRLHSEAAREAEQREPKEAPLASSGKGPPRTGARRAKQEAAAKKGGADADAEGFKKILLILRQHCGVDFSLYRSSTIQRRVTRRLVLNGHETLASYAAFLRGNTKELDALYADVLISVTRFFRNPEAFEVLKRKIFPQLLAQRQGQEPVRVWVLGCSTGQEAYSLAMIFAEVAAAAPRAPKLQIFATDLNEALLEKARHGLYAKTLVQDISPERLRRFFTEEEGGYRVSKLLRDHVVFARQNVISDPPFSRMDLVTCRNVLIYLEPELQKKIFPAFHYALKPGGFLFLGASESVGQFTELFAPADKQLKIFAKKAGPTPPFRLPLPGVASAPAGAGDGALAAAASGGVSAGPPKTAREARALPGGDFTAQREADRISVSQFAPPGVLVDAAGQVLQFRGATGAYLEAPSGKASFDLLKMARAGLLLPLRAALAKAKREKKPVRREGVRVAGRTLALQVIPLRNLKELCFLVLFEEAEAAGAQASSRWGLRASPPAEPSPGKMPGGPTGRMPVLQRRVAELERELAETGEYLQSVQEQNEAAHEELQSINEELETSKEELESTNEELTTINDEMISRNTELNRLNSDLNNLQINTETPILLLTRELAVRRFTPAAAKIFNLLISDVGRSLGGIRHHLDAPDLERLLAEVLDTVTPCECEVQDRDGRWFALRARPYLTVDNKVDGVVVVLDDITALKRSARELKTGIDFAVAILRAAPVPFLVLHGDLRVNTASEAFYRSFHVTPAETEGRPVYEIGNGQWAIPALRTLLEEIIPQKKELTGFEMTHKFADLGLRTMLLNARCVDGNEDMPEHILLAIEDITERKQAEEVQARLGAIVSSADDGILSKTMDGIVTTWNASAERLFGYTAEEIIGNPSVHLTPPDLRDEEEQILKQVRAGEPIKHFETHRMTKDGRRLLVSLTLSPIKDATGKVIGASKIVHDITERKQAETALRESENRKSAILDGALDGIITMNHEGKVVDFNPAAEAMFGLSGEAIVGQVMADKIIPARLREAHRRGLAHFLKSGEGPVLKKRIEVPALHADGHEFPIELSINRIAGIEPPIFTATLRDITARQEAEAALRESEERFRVAVRAVSNIVWTNNAEGRMEGEQPGWSHFTGQTQAEYEGYGWATAVHPDDAQPTIDAWNAAVAGKQMFQFEHRVRRHDGVWRRCAVRALPTLDPTGEIREWVGVHNDVTDERAAADALRAAKERAEAASRAKDDFLAALSHELRTPLTPVLMTASALETDLALPIEVRDQLAMMRRNIELEARLIDDLLDITRISRGKLTIAPVPSDLHQLLQHTAEIVRSDGLGKQVRIVFVLTATRHHALADPTRLQQVFWNLIKNALKFTPSGGTITVTTRNDEEGWIVVSVEDTGVGISAAALPHIFRAFEQGDVAGQHRYGGLGLGLAISQAIVAVHGGAIHAASQGAGYGATFTVILATVDAPATAAPASAGPPAPARGLRLLVVEDHEATRTVLSRLLTRSGHHVTTAGTIHEALTTFAAERFDAVISDLGLPDGSGLELMREIQRQRPVPGIALSGYGMEDDLRQTKAAGFFAHLVKPVNVDQLRQLLTQLTVAP